MVAQVGVIHCESYLVYNMDMREATLMRFQEVSLLVMNIKLR